jgi:hypothetical protein
MSQKDGIRECICKNGKVHPDCDRHQPITPDRIKAQAEVAEFLKTREHAHVYVNGKCRDCGEPREENQK